MGPFTCKQCGGKIIAKKGSSVGECDHCGSLQPVAISVTNREYSLLERANALRAQCQFDTAANMYETIVAEFPEQTEAYWGLVLCKFGIEYVDDPLTKKKVPTCHRSSLVSVMNDPDVQKVLELAEPEAKELYRAEAERIDELRRKIAEVSRKEKPYDIFICYKETAKNNDRTVDSVMAQNIYDLLTAKGYRVFFSRITLEEKIGEEYEPIIFAALHSAKVMLVFCTKEEYVNAVWVRNEWSRYLKLMETDKEKHLIPCYKEMSAKDLPPEFQPLQSQDLGKVGADQDLIRGIEKLIPLKGSAASGTGSGKAYSSPRTPTPQNISLSGASLGDLKLANRYAEATARLENASSPDQFRSAASAFESLREYSNASDLAKLCYELALDHEKRAAYIAERNERQQEERKAAAYREGTGMLERAVTSEDYRRALVHFSQQLLAGYRDSDELKQKCSAKFQELLRQDAERIKEQQEAQAAAQKKQERESAKSRGKAGLQRLFSVILYFIGGFGVLMMSPFFDPGILNSTGAFANNRSELLSQAIPVGIAAVIALLIASLLAKAASKTATSGLGLFGISLLYVFSMSARALAILASNNTFGETSTLSPAMWNIVFILTAALASLLLALALKKKIYYALIYLAAAAVVFMIAAKSFLHLML